MINLYQLMSKIIYLNKDIMKAKKEALIIKRNDCLLSSNYKEADKILKQIQELNDKIYYK